MTRHQRRSREKRVKITGARPDSSGEVLDECDRHPDNASEDNEEFRQISTTQTKNPKHYQRYQTPKI
ncbi:unnamed protein product [Phytophthora fragariaefolia]|uniref:Unnamed protein product n=1 Tax=Phytophthora fragariaefolia TaxID=1490495 RepID=A0A9W6WUX0_9STRA|nr:unnamed protein product [Phytophthora fragariaefolia]